jgi:hypothetical protein
MEQKLRSATAPRVRRAGTITWFVLTGRTDLAPPPGR